MSGNFYITLAECFNFFTSPIRPHSDDVAIVRHQLISLGKPVRGILLGVTKELAELANDKINIIAVDKSAEMIHHQWIGNNTNRIVKVADWLELPSIATNVDFVMGDGVFNVIDRNSQHRLMDCVRSVLADDGVFITRVQCSPDSPESLEQIYQNTTSNFSAFLARLENSLCDSNFEVRPEDLYKKFKEVVTEADIAHFGWTKADLSVLEALKDSKHTLTYLTETMFRKLCEEHGMKIISRFTGLYELSERKSTFVLRKS